MQRRKLTWYGVGALALGIALGHGLWRVDLSLLRMIHEVIVEEDSGRLLFVATQMTVLNALRVLPLYLGAFLLMEAWIPETAPRRQRLLGYLIPAALVPGSYFVIRHVLDTPYDFGVPAALALLGSIGIHMLARFRQGAFVKTTVLGMFIFGWQWLGLTPALTGYGFGNGDLSLALKIAAEFLGQEALLGSWSVLSCGLFVGIAVVMAKFTVDYSNHVRLLTRHQQQESALQQAALRHLEARSRSEMQALVHDLKTPLTTIQGLAGVLGIMQTDPKAKQYAERVEQATERMDHMISEILHPETRQIVPGDKLLRSLQAHLSGTRTAPGREPEVRFDVADNLPAVEVNVVRTIRALANIIQNAQHAARRTAEGRGRGVRVRVGKVGGKLRFRVMDRGIGIDGEHMEQLFTPGFSTKNSSGLGLSFARDVIVEQHGGTLKVHSVPNKGTCIVVELKGVAP